jgi:hypothetical protein
MFPGVDELMRTIRELEALGRARRAVMKHEWVEFAFDPTLKVCRACGHFKGELGDECPGRPIPDLLGDGMRHRHKRVKSSDPTVRHDVCEICREPMPEEEEPDMPSNDELISVAEVKRLRYENDYLRHYIAMSDLPCVYCKLSKADMGKCPSGLSGCSRGEDMVNPPIGRYEDI